MIKDNKIMIGKAGDKEIYLNPAQMNRHGFIAGASGTGKTVTLKVIAESLSELGVPTVIADIKGDLTGMIVPGDEDGIRERWQSMGLESYDVRKYPVHFFDIYQKAGHPIRAVMQQMGPMMLSRIMDLTDAQQGVLNIIFRVAQDMELDIIDLKDLQAMTLYVGEHYKEYTSKYGNIAKQSVGAIQRKLLELETEGGDKFFGEPALDINDWMVTENGLGVMNMIECDELFQHPLLYSTFMLWMLDELYDRLPEVGDVEKPKIAFFFDEAHLLFDGAPKQLLQQIEQTVRLIRSKGVCVFFITQNPMDIPNSVLAQLSHRIQHSLRAYTPSEIKNVKSAANAFRANPEFDTFEMITALKTGQALVSALDEDGAPTIVQKTKILPPHSSMKVADPNRVAYAIETDSIYGKYERVMDAQSAYEDLPEIYAAEEEMKAKAEAAKQAEKEEEARRKAEERAAAKKANEKTWEEKLARKASNKLQNELINMGVRSAKKLLKNLLK
ncbi:MAG TPA: DUF853 domain-containing protein [Erysipelotrichaceae bacterium]|nr:DUF853 domain-containing protein [Erysipelotrichaceae bacterium]